MTHYVYMLRLQNGRIYIGCTKDLDRRYQERLGGTGCHTKRVRIHLTPTADSRILRCSFDKEADRL